MRVGAGASRAGGGGVLQRARRACARWLSEVERGWCEQGAGRRSLGGGQWWRAGGGVGGRAAARSWGEVAELLRPKRKVERARGGGRVRRCVLREVSRGEQGRGAGGCWAGEVAWGERLRWRAGPS
jgi:hypothetical protein